MYFIVMTVKVPRERKRCLLLSFRMFLSVVNSEMMTHDDYRNVCFVTHTHYLRESIPDMSSQLHPPHRMWSDDSPYQISRQFRKGPFS